MTTLLLTTSLAVAGCGGSSHHSTRASSPVSGPSGRGHSTRASSPVGGPPGRGHAQRFSRRGAPSTGSPATAARTGPPAARAAARTFLKGWLLYIYGHAKASVMKDGSPSLTTAIADYPPDPPPTSRHLYGRLVSLTLVRRGASWRAVGHIIDGQDTFDETALLIQTGGRWLVNFMVGGS